MFVCGITGHTGSLGKEIVKSKLGFNFTFFKGDKKHRWNKKNCYGSCGNPAKS